MALVRQCDRCGNIFDHTTSKNERNGIIAVNIKFGSDTAFEYFGTDVKAICPTCMEDFRKWFKEINIDV